MPVTIHDFEDWRDQQTSFEYLAARTQTTVNVSGTEGLPIRYVGTRANAHMFDLLRVQPIMGRTFRPEEDHPSTPPVMVLSYRAWQDRFQGDADVVGRTVRANSELTTIVGVMPEKFDFPGQTDIWMPLRMDPLEFPRGSGPDLGLASLQAIGRLKAGVSIEQAQTEMTAIAARLATAYPESNVGCGRSYPRPCRRVAWLQVGPPFQTVRADFPHTASRWSLRSPHYANPGYRIVPRRRHKPRASKKGRRQQTAWPGRSCAPAR